jgi:phosphatidylglycerol---prolipoprotein diacylglyceryl transferase
LIHELFRIGPIAISPFGVLLVAAFLAAYFELRRGLRHYGVGTEEDASAILFWAGAGGILGGKIYYAILYQDWQLLFDRSGLVWYGGFLLASVLVIWTVRRRRLPAWETLDSAVLGLALGYGIGRIGCFLVGDDYGRPTDLPWGIAFKNGLPPTTADSLRDFGVTVPADIPGDSLLKVHPTQIYETLAALAVWWVGRRLLAKHPPTGVVFAVTLMLLALERFLVEFVRAKDDRFLGPFTVAQLISVALFVLAFLLLQRRRREPAFAPAAGGRR